MTLSNGADLLIMISYSILNFLISPLNTGYYSKCRWISDVSELLLFVTYGSNLLNIHDVEKNVHLLKSPIKLDQGNTIKHENISKYQFFTNRSN